MLDGWDSALVRRQTLEVSAPVDHEVEFIGIGSLARRDCRKALPDRVHRRVLMTGRAPVEPTRKKLAGGSWTEAGGAFENSGEEAGRMGAVLRLRSAARSSPWPDTVRGTEREATVVTSFRLDPLDHIGIELGCLSNRRRPVPRS